MMHPALIKPAEELRDFLRGRVSVGMPDGTTETVTVYSDWERPTNGLPEDFLVIYLNGDMEGVGSDINFAKGYIAVGLYCKMNDDGSVKNNRIQNILVQFDTLIEKLITANYHFEYAMPQFITPTTPNQTSGYSSTVLSLRWHTNNNFNTE